MTQSIAKKLRHLLQTRILVAGVGARDALDARLIENAGFDFVWASSFCVSVAHCVPDASILSMTQFLETARSMNEVIDIPIVFDADTGYGGGANTAYAARLLEEADMGLVALDVGFASEDLPVQHRDIVFGVQRPHVRAAFSAGSRARPAGGSTP